MTAVIIGPRILSELVFKAVQNDRKRSCYVDRQQIRSIDGNLFVSKLKLLILRRWAIRETTVLTVIMHPIEIKCRSFIHEDNCR